MLSIFPAMIALVSIVGLVDDPETVTETITDIAESMGSASAVDTFADPIKDVTSSEAPPASPSSSGSPRRCGPLRLRRRLHARLERDL